MTQVVTTLPTPAPAQVLPRRYIVHLHSQACCNCGLVNEWSTTYSSTDMMTRTGSGAMVLHLIAIEHIDYNLPVSLIEAPELYTPACHNCLSRGRLDLSQLPDPRPTQQWKAAYQPAPTLTGHIAKRTAPAKAKRASPTKTSIVDLF